MFHFIFLLPSSRERGGKGKAEPLKPIFFTNFWISRIEKVIKNSLFHPLFPISPPFSPLPFEAGKGKKSNQKVRKN